MMTHRTVGFPVPCLLGFAAFTSLLGLAAMAADNRWEVGHAVTYAVQQMVS